MLKATKGGAGTKKSEGKRQRTPNKEHHTAHTYIKYINNIKFKEDIHNV